MPYKVTPKSYAGLLDRCFDKKVPLLVRGGPGIGKSAIPRQVFRERARAMQREFIEWVDVPQDQKLKIIKDPSKYFVFCDQRTSSMDTTSIVGVPNMANTSMLENIPYSWIVYFTQPDAAGVIFFDEINLAAPVVQAITYAVIYDRVISDRRMAKDVYVFGAGNRLKDKAHVFDIPLPLLDRFSEVELDVSAQDWLEWAAGNGINLYLLSFIGWKEGYLYKVDVAKEDKASTPRGVVRASTLLKDVDIESDMAHQLVSISVGESFATEFQAYIKCVAELEWSNIFSNPSVVKTMQADKLWAVNGGLLEKYQKAPDDTQLAGRIFAIMGYMRGDFAVGLLRMLRDTNRVALKKHITRLDGGKKIAEQYGHLMIDVDM